MLTTFVNIYSVNVPVTVNVATVQDPSTPVVLVPGATAKEAGLQAVAILKTPTPVSHFFPTPHE